MKPFSMLAFSLLIGCSNEGPTSAFLNQPKITEVNEAGLILSVDPGDWDGLGAPGLSVQNAFDNRPRRLEKPAIAPVSPNPIKGSEAYIVFAFHKAMQGKIYVLDEKGNLLSTLDNSNHLAGTYQIRWTIADSRFAMTNGFYRIVFSTDGYEGSGDVEIRR